MAQLKTQPNDKNVVEFLNTVENETKREDSFTILELMKQVTGSDPIMWGDSISVLAPTTTSMLADGKPIGS